MMPVKKKPNTMSDERPYRPCVGVVLLNNDGKVFVGERIDTPGAWQFPQGGIDADETPEQAAFRELYEEAGCNKAEIIQVAEETTRYDLPEHLQEKFWGGQYRGQEQTWIAARFLGTDDDINLEAHDPPEFSQWKWVDIEDTLDLIVPFKRETYEHVIKTFKNLTLTD